MPRINLHETSRCHLSRKRMLAKSFKKHTDFSFVKKKECLVNRLFKCFKESIQGDQQITKNIFEISKRGLFEAGPLGRMPLLDQNERLNIFFLSEDGPKIK